MTHPDTYHESDVPFDDLDRRMRDMIEGLPTGVPICVLGDIGQMPQPKPPRKPRPAPVITAPANALRTPAQAAARLQCSIKTLNGHVASGDLKCLTIGHGKKRPRRRYTDADLDEFIANQTRKDVSLCPSSKTSVRPSTATDSRSTVVAFSARRSARPGAKQKR